MCPVKDLAGCQFSGFTVISLEKLRQLKGPNSGKKPFGGLEI